MKNTTEYVNVNLSTDTTTSLSVTNFDTISLTSNNYSIKTGSVERIKMDSTNVTINTTTLSLVNNSNTFVTTSILSDKGDYVFDRVNNFIIKKIVTTANNTTTTNELFKLSETILNVSNLTTVDINVPDIKLSGTNTIVNSINLTTDVTTLTIKKGSLEYIKVTNNNVT
jgi:hypothetical protein